MARYDLALEPELIDLGSVSQRVRLDCSNPRTHFHCVLDADVDEVIVENAAPGRFHEFTIEVVQGAGGTIRSGWKWDAGVAPMLSVGEGAVDIISGFTRDGGTTVYGFLAGRTMM